MIFTQVKRLIFYSSLRVMSHNSIAVSSRAVTIETNSKQLLRQTNARNILLTRIMKRGCASHMRHLTLTEVVSDRMNGSPDFFVVAAAVAFCVVGAAVAFCVVGAAVAFSVGAAVTFCVVGASVAFCVVGAAVAFSVRAAVAFCVVGAAVAFCVADGLVATGPCSSELLLLSLSSSSSCLIEPSSIDFFT